LLAHRVGHTNDRSGFSKHPQLLYRKGHASNAGKTGLSYVSNCISGFLFFLLGVGRKVRIPKRIWAREKHWSSGLFT
jgi:hypothetical protein